MSKNIEMNIKQDNGQYEIVYPQVKVNNIIDISNNFYNKQETLTQEIASLFNFEQGTIPNNVFSFLGKYNLHWWRRRSVQKGYFEKRTQTSFEGSGSEDAGTYIAKFYEYRGLDDDKSYTLRYSDNLIIGESGEISLNNPITTGSFTKINYSALDVVKGKYVESVYVYFGGVTVPTIKGLYFIPQEEFQNYNSSDYFAIGTQTMYSISSEYKIIYGNWEYLQSKEESTYPKYGEQDGYEYEYLGIPFENFPIYSKIEKGSYIGTGVYGAENPNILTFKITPNIVIIYSAQPTIFIKDVTSGCTWGDYCSGGYYTCEWNGNILKWWVSDQQWHGGGTGSGSTSEGPKRQLNHISYPYKYIAIGQ